jgi:hypothetical protein
MAMHHSVSEAYGSWSQASLRLLTWAASQSTPYVGVGPHRGTLRAARRPVKEEEQAGNRGAHVRTQGSRSFEHEKHLGGSLGP